MMRFFSVKWLVLSMAFLCGCSAEMDRAVNSERHVYYGAIGESGFIRLMNRAENAELRKELLERTKDLSKPDSPYYIDSENIVESLGRRAGKGGPGRVLSGLAETLGPAAAVTRDESMLQYGASVLSAAAEPYARQGAIMKDKIALQQGEMAHGLALCWLFFGDKLDSEDRQRVAQMARGYVESILEEAEAPAWYNPYSNWTAVSVGGAGLLALTLEDIYPVESAEWLARAKRLLCAYFEGSYVDGAYVEHGYIEYAMVDLTTLMAALAARGDRDLIDHPNIKAMANWRVFNSIPGGTALDPRGTTGYAVPGQVSEFARPWPLLLAREHNNPEIRWLWQRSDRSGPDFPFVQWNHSGTKGLSLQRVIFAENAPQSRAPEAGWQSRFYAGRGLAIWRDGFDKDDFFFSISAGTPRPTTHDQGDAGHFNLYSDGVVWATDPGPGGRMPGSPGQGVSHSVVQIDGRSQALTGGGSTSGGVALGFEEQGDSAWFGADLTDPYNFALWREEKSFDTKKFGQEIAAGSEQVLRHTIVVNHAETSSEDRRHYVVLFDDLTQDDREHEFSWQMMTEAGHETEIKGDLVSLRSGSSWLELHGYATDGAGIWQVEPVSFADDKKPEAFQKIKFSLNTVNPKIVTLLVPGSGDQERPQVRFEQSEKAVSVIVAWSTGRQEKVVWTFGRNRPTLIISDK